MFDIRTHVFPGQHIRQFDRANRYRDEDTQRLEVKQYIPLSNQRPRDGDVTIIGACATSFPKEVYEPLWAALLQQCENRGLRIRSIWVADKSDHAASAALNKDILFDDQSPNDLARDLLHMVNVYRDEFKPPIVGFGHSMGGTSLLELARMHPRLLASLILIDPIIGPDIFKIGIPLISGASLRPDLWKSREEAEKFFRSSGAMKRWHPEALQAYLKHGLRDTPTKLYPEPGKVTLSTTKANESYAYVRPCFEPSALEGDDARERGLAKYPDWDRFVLEGHSLYRAESSTVWNDLPSLRPSTFYIVPQYGPFAAPEQVESMVGRTGTGSGGSGGRRTGRVRHDMLKGQGHLVPLEAPLVCAESVVQYLVEELPAWARRRKIAREDGDGKSIDGVALSDEWKRQVKLYREKHMPKRNVRSKM